MSSPTVVLSQDLETSVDGVNLKWSLSNFAGLEKEVTLIYYKNSSDADILSVDVAPTRKINLNLESGMSYSFQVQVTDTYNTTAYSNTLVLTSPYMLSPPTISSYIGLDAELQIHVDASGNTLTSSDTVEFIFKKSDNTVFWVVKAYQSSGTYSISADDGIMNNISYRVACMFQPSALSTLYTSPSSMSNSMTMTPTNIPNAPGSISITSNASTGETLPVATVIWTRPSDFSEWSSTFQILVSVTDTLGNETTMLYIDNDATSHTFTNLTRSLMYFATVKYSNNFGSGPSISSSPIVLTTRSDAPTITSIVPGDGTALISWMAPAYTGATPITGFRLYKDQTFVRDFDSTSLSFLVEGLTNGVSYDFALSVLNATYPSELSAQTPVIPVGQMSIISVVPVSKTLTITIRPNGKPVNKVLIVALDSDPDSTLDTTEFVVDIPIQNISQSASSDIVVTKTFSHFTSAISFYCIIASNDNNSAFLKSVV